jgi:uncharacterized iron-regulated membrane protein
MGSLYPRIWRWHFYAGLFAMPFIVLLSLSGAFYLFKPQVDRWEERAFDHQPIAGTVRPSAQLAAAERALPDAHLVFYRLPERTGDSAMLHMALAGGAMRDVFVGPQGRVLGSLDPDDRLIALDRKFHGQLLLGRRGSWLVELAASWAIVLILTGLYLWWPRGQGRGVAGVLWPRRQALWRDLHAVTGFWVSGLALIMLISGLPWADAWGSAFKAVRQQAGWVAPNRTAPDWTIGGRPAGDDPHAEHDHAAMMAGMNMDMTPAIDPAALDRMAAIAGTAHLAFPAMVVPPGAPAGEGGTGKPAKGWVIKSEAQNRPLRVTLRYDARGERLTGRDGFAQRHPIDRLVGYTTAWHEGALLGWVNQLIGLCTALALLLMVASSFTLWRRRKPADRLGAPAAVHEPRLTLALAGLICLLGVLLPLLGLSLLAVLAVEAILRRSAPRTSAWLGLA